jgi:hypothetical protein
MDYTAIRDGIFALFDIINNKLFITRVVELEKSINSSPANYISKSIYRNALSALYNLSYLEYKYPETWRNAYAFNSMLMVARFTAIHPALANFQMVAYLTLANVYQDAHVPEYMSEFKLAIGVLMDMFTRCTRYVSTKNLRLKMNVYEDDLTIYDVTYVEEYDTKWNFIELANAVYKLSVNDNLKQVLYFDSQLKGCLREAILRGFEVEKIALIKDV